MRPTVVAREPDQNLACLTENWMNPFSLYLDAMARVAAPTLKMPSWPTWLDNLHPRLSCLPDNVPVQQAAYRRRWTGC